MSAPQCRFCRADLTRLFVDLGTGPMVSSYLRAEQLQSPEYVYPMQAYVCEECLLVQLPDTESPESMFGDYPYFSSVSKGWLEHARRYVEGIIGRCGIGPEHLVVEIASNDGYLLQYFHERGIPVQGVEPARNIAEVARGKGIPTLSKFFGTETARELVAEGRQADLIVGNNVLAHVPAIGDFVAGLKILLKPGGRITLEFPHLLRTMMENQFDQVFHEHASYLSLLAVEKIFAANDLAVVDVEELPTHGGSIRVHARHSADAAGEAGPGLLEVRRKEKEYGLGDMAAYDAFLAQTRGIKYGLLKLLVELKEAGKSIVGYGAPGKGCVMLNYCGIGSEFLDYLVDLSPAKQGLYMPGVRLPIHSPERIAETKPDYILILPWNLRDEIMTQLSHVGDWGGMFVIPIPEPRVVECRAPAPA